ncbi:MAG: transglutaminase family protein [Methylococcales bacterium]
MKYRITHSTLYHYSQPVGLCQNEARLQPRNFWRQHCHTSYFDITPEPIDFQERLDYFGNRVTYFAVQKPHTKLNVTAISEVTIFPKQNVLELFNQIAWESVRNILQGLPLQGLSQSQSQQSQVLWQNQDYAQELFDAKQFLLDSPMVKVTPELAEYARISFQPNRPLVDVVHDLMARIYNDFTYDPTFTTIATPLSDVLNFRRGVCQDFAHLAIGCLRAYGIAARYISGYVETLPEPGKQRLTGADASHAWFSVYIPNSGWLDFDPTNNTIPLDQHITLAWGRDFSDVTPLKGIAFGGGQHVLSVSVDVLRIE